MEQELAQQPDHHSHIQILEAPASRGLLNASRLACFEEIQIRQDNQGPIPGRGKTQPRDESSHLPTSTTEHVPGKGLLEEPGLPGTLCRTLPHFRTTLLQQLLPPSWRTPPATSQDNPSQ